MACTYLICDSFDYGTLAFKDTDHFLADIQAVPHTGTYCLRLNGETEWGRYAITGTPDNISVGIWIKHFSLGWNIDDSIWVRAKLSSGEYIDARWDGTNHTFDVYVDGAKVADGSQAIPVADGWFHFQLYIYVDNAGFIKTKINGAADIDYSGDTLPVAASAEVEYVYLWMQAGGTTAYADDVVIGTDDFTGDVRVDYIVPTADTAVDDWTASAGDSFSCVDEVPKNDADYIYTATNTDETELDLAAWDETNKTPILVDAIARAQESAATAESFKLGVDSNAVDDTTQHLLTPSWLYYHHYMNQNPDGPAAWADAAIEALKLRVEAVI